MRISSSLALFSGCAQPSEARRLGGSEARRRGGSEARRLGGSDEVGAEAWRTAGEDRLAADDADAPATNATKQSSGQRLGPTERKGWGIWAVKNQLGDR